MVDEQQLQRRFGLHEIAACAIPKRSVPHSRQPLVQFARDIRSPILYPLLFYSYGSSYWPSIYLPG
jgi:hypothetical protein